MSSMKARLLTAFVGIPLVIIILITSEYFSWILTCALSVVCAIMSMELLSAKKLHNKMDLVLPCVLFSFVAPLLAATPYLMIPFYLFGLALFAVMIFDNQNIKFSDVAFTFTGIIMVVFGIMSIIMLNNYYKGYISFVFALCVGTSWIADAGAYFAGVFLGKHKLCPNISPNKTVEGFIGGMIFGGISAPIFGFIFTLIYHNFNVNYIFMIILGILCSLISVLGDLSFSLIKRYCGIKDYGSIFPGHGGILDRFDSVIFVSPLVYLFCSNLNVIII